MTSTTANATDDVSSEITLFGAVIFSVSNATTVLANLIFVVSKCSVQSSEFAELIALVIVLTFGSGSSLGMISVDAKEVL
jgi:hypothetical protein